jgi:RNA polymerase sigma-70 factor (ECF subfamily)
MMTIDLKEQSWPSPREQPAMREAHGVAVSIDREREPDDASLVEAARVDPTAFAPLYERYRDRVYWYLRTRTVSTDDAADLLQQVFLQALDRIDQYRPQRGPFVAWLFGIARHAAGNHNRRRRSTVSWDLVPELLRPISDDDPESEAVHKESLTRLSDVFASLDRDKRELLVLRYVVGLSFAEIGPIIGKNEAATRQQVSRLLRSLKEHYREEL